MNESNVECVSTTETNAIKIVADPKASEIVETASAISWDAAEEAYGTKWSWNPPLPADDLSTGLLAKSSTLR